MIALAAIPTLVKLSTWVLAGGWRYLAGATVVLALVASHGYAWKSGYDSADGACQAAALRAERDAALLDRDNIAAQAVQASARVKELEQTKATNAGEIERLRKQVARRPLQSTKTGAKRDADALMDDRCNATDTGARGLQ